MTGAQDMRPDVPEPPHRAGWAGVVRATFTTKIGWWPRAALPIGFFTIAINDNLWFSLALAVLWSFSAQMALAGVHMVGWVAGVDWLDELWKSGGGSRSVDMVDFMNFCDEHQVPPQDVAALLWKEKD